MIFSEETLRYPAACYGPFPLIHTFTIWYCQKKHKDIQQYIIFFLHQYISVQYDIVRRNTKISSNIYLSFSINTFQYNMILWEETLRYPAACPTTLIHTGTIEYCQKKHKDIQQYIIFFSINTYLYNMILSEKHNYIQQHIIFLRH